VRDDSTIMADRRGKGKKGKNQQEKVDEDKPEQIEKDVAKYLRSKLPQKRTTLVGHKVDYFISVKAIDCLLDSKWAKDSGPKSPALFTSRDTVIDFLDTMLRHKFFHRARKIIVKTEPKKKKTDTDAVESSAAEEKREEKVRERKKAKKTAKSGAGDDNGDKTATAGTSGGDQDVKEKSEKEKVEKKEKREKEGGVRKVKLDMHLEQIFVDGNEPYVWIYDPIPMKAWFIGLGMVFGAIAICLFPLWPRVVRNYVYYLSIAAAGFLFFIIGLAVLRLIIFCVVWAVSFGKHHFWLLPNLTEDVGFVQSFIPLYHYEYQGDDEKEDGDKKKKDGKSKKSNAKKKEKDSDREDNAVADDKDSSESQTGKDSEGKDAEISGDDSERGSQDSQHVNGSDNGFELLDPIDDTSEREHVTVK